jgi:hypothetical protein
MNLERSHSRQKMHARSVKMKSDMFRAAVDASRVFDQQKTVIRGNTPRKP